MCIFVTLITMLRRDIISRDKKKLCGHRNWATKLQLAETVLFCFFFVIYASEFFNISGRKIQTTRNQFSVHNYMPSYCMYIQLHFEWKHKYFCTSSNSVVYLYFCQKQILVYTSTRRWVEKMNMIFLSI